MDQVAPVMVTVREGDTVVQEGETITEQDPIVFKALGSPGPARAGRSGWASSCSCCWRRPSSRGCSTASTGRPASPTT